MPHDSVSTRTSMYNNHIHYICTTFHVLLERAQQQNTIVPEMNGARRDYLAGVITKDALLTIARQCDAEEARCFAQILAAEQESPNNTAEIEELYHDYAGIHYDLAAVLDMDTDREDDTMSFELNQ